MKNIKSLGNIILIIVLFILLGYLIYSSILTESKVKTTYSNESINADSVEISKDNVDQIIIEKLSSYTTLENIENLKKDFKYNSNIDENFIKSDKSILGYFDGVIDSEGELIRVAGWAYSDNEKIEYILFINDKNEVKGAALLGAQRNGLSKAIGKEGADNSGFVGYLKANKSENISALVKLKEKNSFIKLEPIIKIN